mmetsp:Transcript_12300/g.30077  ORF Transcript_12300/g.30077 Transcript_12300/m.30077 type:complete len:396 (+) Transcript_12300:214-1401(+)
MASKPSIVRFKFVNFENLPHSPGYFINSSDMKDRDGNVWKLRIYPGGMAGVHNTDAHNINDNGAAISLSLLLQSVKTVTASIAFIVRDAVGNVYHYDACDDTDTFAVQGNFLRSDYHYRLKRSEIVEESNNILLDGALIVHVEIQTRIVMTFQPPNTSAGIMKRILESKEDADVVFYVRGMSILAHKLILKMNAPILFSLCRNRSMDAPLSIEDTSPEVFRIIIQYIYIGETSEAMKLLQLGKENEADKIEVRAAMGKELIDAADRYGIVGLKLSVETALVDRCIINLDNAVDWLLFADAKNCPLLKEAATNYCAGMVKDVLNSKASEQLKQSPRLLSELLLAVSNDSNDCFDETSQMSVNDLRAKLYEKGLDVDGSKETLVTRINTPNKRQRVE